MASIDLNGLSLSELKQLQKDVKRAIGGYSDRKKQEVISALEARALELGFSLADLLGVKKQRKSTGKAGPKYRHPEDANVTWSGRGRKPSWFVDAVAAGRKQGELAI